MAFLTIGMPTYKDFDGVYFTIQSLRVYHDLSDCELIVVDNFGCPETERFSKSISGLTYIQDKSGYGTAYAKNLVFENARSPYVLCVDCHVLLLPGSLPSLIQFYRDNPGTGDLIQGPMYYDNLKDMATQMDPVWRGQMYGIWGFDPQIRSGISSFEIPLHGMGLFSSRREAWPGFNPRFRGFGGEEGYIHDKYRRLGRRCLCLSRLGWVHRFGRPQGVPYPLLLKDKVKNYFHGHLELGQDLGPIHDHFQEFISRDQLKLWEGECHQELAKNPLPSNLSKVG